MGSTAKVLRARRNLMTDSDTSGITRRRDKHRHVDALVELLGVHNSND